MKRPFQTLDLVINYIFVRSKAFYWVVREVRVEEIIFNQLKNVQVSIFLQNPYNHSGQPKMDRFTQPPATRRGLSAKEPLNKQC